MAKQKFFINEDELDNFQVQLLQRRIDQSLVVSGCAGSGKSILALWKAKQIQELPDGASYKFIVFTKTLHQYMLDGIRSIGIDRNNFTYHWAWEHAGCPGADYIIVDEVQDFTKEDIQKFKDATKKMFFFWGDSKQSIFDGMGGKHTQPMMEIAHDAGVDLETLCLNHRLPMRIARLAAIIIDDSQLVGRCQKEGAELPKILRYNTLEEQLDAAMEIIENRNITDAGILFPTNSLVQQAYDYLINRGCKAEAKYDDGGNHIMDLNFSSDNPKLMTYHSAKGLQFEAVFMPECSAERPNDRAPLYVAMTRSYQYLYIMYSDARSPLLNHIPTNLYETSISDGAIEL